jgi:hypothetical protein
MASELLAGSPKDAQAAFARGSVQRFIFRFLGIHVQVKGSVIVKFRQFRFTRPEPKGDTCAIYRFARAMISYQSWVVPASSCPVRAILHRITASSSTASNVPVRSTAKRTSLAPNVCHMIFSSPS